MERIKSLKDVILRPDGIFAEVFEVKRSSLILPGAESSRESLDYLKVVAVGSGITDLKPGDYVMDMNPGDIAVYNINNVKYGLIHKGNIRIAVTAENFDCNYKDDTVNLSI